MEENSVSREEILEAESDREISLILRPPLELWLSSECSLGW